jgi:flagellar FliL protein
MSNEAAAPAGAKPKSKSSTLLIVIVAVLALGGGAAGAFFYVKKNPGQPTAPKPPEPGIFALEPFVVNLSDGGGRRFLKLTLKLVVTEEQAKELEEDEVAKARVRSSVLEFLTTQTAEHLVTPEGKAELKKEIAERGTHALEHEHVKVADVLFTEFVVQF